MSVCDPSDPNACEKCCIPPETVNLIPHSGRPAGKPKKDELEELEELLTEMRSLRNEARRLTRSGHPGVQAQALKHMSQAEDNIRWIHARMVEAKDA